MFIDCSRWRQWTSSLRQQLPQSPLTYLLFCVFGIGSWVAINGMWAQVPILVITLPECGKITAILSVIIQLANIGPLTYIIVKYILRRLSSIYLEITSVFILVVVGTVSCVLLAFFWSDTANVFGSSHSVALITLTFTLALVDCTSSVVFVPFMKHFPAVYISGLYIGEGLGGILPSILALLVQGSVKNGLKCNGSYVDHNTLGIRFGPNIFFVFLAVMMLLCGLAFLAINVLPMVRKHMVSVTPYSKLDTKSDSDGSSASQHSEEDNLDEEEDKVEEVNSEQEQSDKVENLGNGTDMSPDKHSNSLHISERNPAIQVVQAHHPSVKSFLSIIWSNLTILLCLALLNFIANGALTSISPFIFQPYGNTVFHLAVNLGLLANPLASFFFALVPHKSRDVTATLTAAACLLGVYELVIALLSPYPPLKGPGGGLIIIVSSGPASSALFTLSWPHYLEP